MKNLKNIVSNCIDESILRSNDAGLLSARKDLSKKLANRHDSMKLSDFVNPKTGEHFDVYGNKVEIGDVVVNAGSFSTCMVEVLVITEFDIEERVPEAILCYNPWKNREQRCTLDSVMKIIDPEKYK